MKLFILKLAMLHSFAVNQIQNHIRTLYINT